MNQRLGVIMGLGVLVLCGFGYMSWQGLKELGKDRDSAMVQSLAPEGGLWSEIASVETSVLKEIQVGNRIRSYHCSSR